MTVRAHHIEDERLFDSYFAGRYGDAADPRVAEHLTDCGDCSARYADVVRVMDALRAESEAEANEVFTTERLRAQYLAIARRVEHVGRPARVISFPRRLVGRHMNVTGRQGITRWVYAAAAAGLVIGVGLTSLYDSGFQRLQRPHPLAAIKPATPPAREAPVATAGTGMAAEAADDAFLSELEVAVERPRTRELQAFEALTPRVREPN